MTLTDFLQMVRRRWVTAVVSFLLVLGAAVFALQTQNPVYEATATVGLVPTSSSSSTTNDLTSITLLGQAAAILPLYSEALTSIDTRRLAAADMPPGMALGSVSASTFQNFPTILRINTRSTSPVAAQRSAQAFVTALQKRANAGDIGVNGLISLQELGSPVLPTTPVSPHKKLTLGIGLMLGLVLAVAAAWLRENVGGKIESSDALAQASGLPVFGEVPDARRVGAITSVPMWLNDDRLRFVNEAMRDLGLTLQLTQFESDSVLVTSPEGQHGKTTVSFGIAVALARSGVATLLVDGDLRRGRIEEFFVDEPNRRIRKRPGLVDVLRGMPLESAIQATSLPNLSVLTSGELQDDPNELLDIAFPAALREMERRSAVVIDGTPLVPINDARVIARFVGSTVVVAAAGQVSRGQVKRALDRMSIIGVKPTAVILNRARQRHSANYGLYLNAPRQQPAATEPPPPTRAAAPPARRAEPSPGVTLVEPESFFVAEETAAQQRADDERRSSQ